MDFLCTQFISYIRTSDDWLQVGGLYKGICLLDGMVKGEEVCLSPSDSIAHMCLVLKGYSLSLCLVRIA